MLQDDVIFYGHPNVLSFHRKSIEITRYHDLSRRGDCIIGVKSNKGCGHLDQQLRRAIGNDDAVVKFELVVGDSIIKMAGRGSSKLLAVDTKDIVIRKSNFCCPRTLSICCDRAASDIPISMVKMLQDPGTKGLLRITVE